jgi:hypothetical protein
MSDRMVLTGEAAVMMLRKVVFEKGADFVYPQAQMGQSCVNFTDDGNPSCIVGHVLADLGLTYFQAMEAKIVDSGVFIVSHALDGMNFPWEISVPARKVLATAQNFQDAGYTWGDSLAKAEMCLADGIVREPLVCEPGSDDA